MSFSEIGQGIAKSGRGLKMVPTTGLEPVRCYSLEPESSASANSATWATSLIKHLRSAVRAEFDVVLFFVLEIRHARQCNAK